MAQRQVGVVVALFYVKPSKFPGSQTNLSADCKHECTTCESKEQLKNMMKKRIQNETERSQKA